MALAHALQQALRALARGALGVEPALDLLSAALQVGDPLLQLQLGHRSHVGAHRRALGLGGLLGLGQLALDAVESQPQLARIVLAVAQPRTEALDLHQALALGPQQPLLGLARAAAARRTRAA